MATTRWRATSTGSRASGTRSPRPRAPTVGFCLDTCHAHAGGIDLATAVDKVRASPAGSTWSTPTTAATPSTPAPTGTPTSAPASPPDLFARVVRAAGAPVIFETPGGAAEHRADFAWAAARAARARGTTRRSLRSPGVGSPRALHLSPARAHRQHRGARLLPESRRSPIFLQTPAWAQVKPEDAGVHRLGLDRLDRRGGPGRHRAGAQPAAAEGGPRPRRPPRRARHRLGTDDLGAAPADGRAPRGPGRVRDPDRTARGHRPWTAQQVKDRIADDATARWSTYPPPSGTPRVPGSFPSCARSAGCRSRSAAASRPASRNTTSRCRSPGVRRTTCWRA